MTAKQYLRTRGLLFSEDSELWVKIGEKNYDLVDLLEEFKDVNFKEFKDAVGNIQESEINPDYDGTTPTKE